MKGRILTDKQIAAFAGYLKNEEKSENTIEKYIRDVRAFAAYVSNAEITKETVIAYKNNLLYKNYAARSINSMLASINGLLSFLGWGDLKVKSIKLQQQIYCPEEKELTKAEYIRHLGYDVSLEFSSPRMNVYEEYGIENTDIKLQSIWETSYITSILAPAELLIPEYIGKPGNEFYINDVFVIPNATGYGHTFIQYGWGGDEIITKDTLVIVLTEASFNTAIADAGLVVTFDEVYTPNAAYPIHHTPTATCSSSGSFKQGM